MAAPQASITSAIESITARLSTKAATSGTQTLAPHEALMLTLNSQFPGGDVGVLASLFLNQVSLSAGQAVSSMCQVMWCMGVKVMGVLASLLLNWVSLSVGAGQAVSNVFVMWMWVCGCGCEVMWVCWHHCS